MSRRDALDDCFGYIVESAAFGILFLVTIAIIWRWL
jgi:hypothetical protein